MTIDGVEYRMVESRSPFTRGVSGPASANSFSAPYLYDLDPVETIHRSYFPSDSTSYRYRWEDWVVDADGTETLVEYSNDILMEVLEN